MILHCARSYDDNKSSSCFRHPTPAHCHACFYQGFIADRDVEIVRRSTKGLGTNEANLINTLCNRTKKQLDAVDLRYHKEASGRLSFVWCD